MPGRPRKTLKRIDKWQDRADALFEDNLAWMPKQVPGSSGDSGVARRELVRVPYLQCSLRVRSLGQRSATARKDRTV